MPVAVVNASVPASAYGARTCPRTTATETRVHYFDVLRAERDAAEATLGRPLIDPIAFAADVLALELDEALNREHGRIN